MSIGGVILAIAALVCALIVGLALWVWFIRWAAGL